MDIIEVTNPSTLERVYREIGDRLWWALLAYTGDREIASDAVAEAFSRALAGGDSIRDPAPWVWRVAFRVAAAELRAVRRSPTPIQGEVADGVSYEIDDEVAAVLVALRRLSRRQRAAFILFYLDDRPMKEIAKLLGMAPGTVSVHLHLARQRLRKILGDHDEG